VKAVVSNGPKDVKAEKVNARTEVRKEELSGAVVFETRDADKPGSAVHRSYVVK
jgi:hypothetical protein